MPASGNSTSLSTFRDRGRRQLQSPRVDEATGVTDSAVGDEAWPTAEGLAGLTAFRDRVDYSLSLDLVLHLAEGGHDREEHGPHGGCGVNVAAAQVQHTQAGTTAAELLSVSEHILCPGHSGFRIRRDEGRQAHRQHVEAGKDG